MPTLNRARYALYAGLAVLVLTGVAAALGPVDQAAAKPRRADITITQMTAEPAEVIMDETVFLTIDVANLGTAPASVTVLVTLPPTLESRSFNAPGEQWECVFHSPSWTCVNGLAPGQVAEPLHLNAGVVGGAPGDVLTVTARATTPDRELSTTNNTGQASVNLVAAATIHGTVWVDGNLDGQRQPGEPGVPSSSGGFSWLRVYTEDGIQILPSTRDGIPHLPSIVVDADGNYSGAVKPGRYFVEVNVSPIQWDYTTPNIGDESTDSDVIPTFSDDFDSLAHSDVFEVTSGSETIVDVGLTELAAT
jgi:Domain of unknown function DUF11